MSKADLLAGLSAISDKPDHPDIDWIERLIAMSNSPDAKQSLFWLNHRGEVAAQIDSSLDGRLASAAFEDVRWCSWNNSMPVVIRKGKKFPTSKNAYIEHLVHRGDLLRYLGRLPIDHDMNTHTSKTPDGWRVEAESPYGNERLFYNVDIAYSSSGIGFIVVKSYRMFTNDHLDEEIEYQYHHEDRIDSVACHFPAKYTRVIVGQTIETVLREDVTIHAAGSALAPYHREYTVDSNNSQNFYGGYEGPSTECAVWSSTSTGNDRFDLEPLTEWHGLCGELVVQGGTTWPSRCWTTRCGRSSSRTFR